MQHVKEWPHMRDTDNLSRLDLILSKYEQDIENVMYKAPVGFGKHAVITFDIIVEDPDKEKQGMTPRLNFHKGDFFRLNELLSNVN